MMLQLLKKLFQQCIDNIDSGNCNITEQEQQLVFNYINNTLHKNPQFTKAQACDYLNISRATFDRYVHDGFIPQGEKLEGSNTKVWYKMDLDNFVSKQEYLQKEFV